MITLPFHLLRPFRGSIRTDGSALQAAAGDFGGIVTSRPMAVLDPETIDDVATAVRFAREHGVRIAPQGQRHTTFGQAQVDNGLVISTARLKRSWIDPEARVIDAEGGLRWEDLVRRTMNRGLFPPVLTDFLGLSVGGTLSVGGIGGQSFCSGAQTDNVLELTVVTGTGEIRVCSASQDSELFDACRAGLGQFGIIVRARLSLVPAPALVRRSRVIYTDSAALLADQKRLASSGYFYSVEGSVIPNEKTILKELFGEAAERLRPVSSRWLYQLKFARALDFGHGPDDEAILASLSSTDQVWSSSDMTAFEFVNRMAPEVDRMRANGLWQASHPYLSVFLPEARFLDVLDETLSSTTYEELNHGPIHVLTLDRSTLRTPNLSLPAQGRHLILFDLLRNSRTSPTHLIEKNRQIYQRCRLAGGTLYPIGAVPLGETDWEAQYSGKIDRLRQAKQRFDPDGLLHQLYGPADLMRDSA